MNRRDAIKGILATGLGRVSRANQGTNAPFDRYGVWTGEPCSGLKEAIRACSDELYSIAGS